MGERRGLAWKVITFMTLVVQKFYDPTDADPILTSDLDHCPGV